MIFQINITRLQVYKEVQELQNTANNRTTQWHILHKLEMRDDECLHPYLLKTIVPCSNHESKRVLSVYMSNNNLLSLSL